MMSGVALALPNDEAGAFLIDHLRVHRVAPEVMGPLLTHAAKHLPKDVDVAALAEIAQKGVAGDLDLQLELLLALRAGVRNRSQRRAGGDQGMGAQRLLAGRAGVGRRGLDRLGGAGSRRDARATVADREPRVGGRRGAPSLSQLVPAGRKLYRDVALPRIRDPGEP